MMISQVHMLMLEALAREGRETPQQLLERLLEKENFERHGIYDAMNGKLYTKECMCLDCFMKERLGHKADR